MSRFKIFSARTAAAVLSAAMVFSGTAMAAPTDELNDILEKQQELAGDSLLEETLGLSELGEAIGENGLQLRVKAGLDADTFDKMREESGYTEDEAQFLKDSSFVLNVQVDKELEKWLVQAGLGSDAESILDASLYGDAEQLALSLPQLFSGALSLKAGDLKEQLLNSELGTILGITEEDASQMPSMDMSFYPDGDLFGDLLECLEEDAEQINESMQVEKTEDGDVTTYAATVDTSDVMELYRTIFDKEFSIFTDSPLASMTEEDLSDLDVQLDQMISGMESAIGDTVTMNFEVRDGLVEKISYELYLDTAELEQALDSTEMTELVEEVAAEAGNAADAVQNVEGDVETALTEAESAANESEAETQAQSDSISVQSETAQPDTSESDVTADSFRGTASYEVTYVDPAQPSKGIEFHMDMTDEDSGETIALQMNYETETEGTKETVSYFMELLENGETLYSGTPFTASFDASTGDLDAIFAVADDDSSVELKLDSTFTEIEKGQSFVWTIDELSLAADGEKVGMNAEVKVNADPGAFEAPAEQRVLLELTQGGLLDLVNEITENAQAWAEKYEQPYTEETETTEDAVEVLGEAATEENIVVENESGEEMTELVDETEAAGETETESAEAPETSEVVSEIPAGEAAESELVTE